eukprot:24484-Eustigmatos_ZCMA.PRE.1
MVYSVMVEPPSSPGEYVMVAVVEDAGIVTLLMEGAPGVVEGVMELEASDTVPSPPAFVANTVNV